MVERQLRRRGIADDACSTRWHESHVSSSSRRSFGRTPTRTVPSRSGMGRRSRTVHRRHDLLAPRVWKGDEHVLDVGTGSGYQAAVWPSSTREVITIERIPELAEAARGALAEAGYPKVEVRVGDGSLGVPERAPFDGIAVAAAAPTVPHALLAARRGRSYRPASWYATGQELVLVVRTPAGRWSVRSIPCRFVPLLGDEGLGGLILWGAVTTGPRLPCDDGGVVARRTRLRRVLACARARRPAQAEELGAAPQVLCRRASGYVVNLAVYALLLNVVGLHYISAAAGSFLVAVTNNYAGIASGRSGPSAAASPTRGCASSSCRHWPVANLAVLHFLVTLGLGEVVAQAIAIVLVTPVNFVGNKLWSFGPRR